MAKRTIKISGKEEKKHPFEIINDNYEELQTVAPLKTSRGSDKLVTIDVEDQSDIVNIQFEDGGEWIGSALDINEIFQKGEHIKRGGDDDLFPSHLSVSGKRGALDIGLKLVSFFRSKKKAPEWVAHELGEYIDNSIMPNPGLKRVNESFELKDFDSSSSPGQHYLLFLHGTCSSTVGSFGHLIDQEAGKSKAWKDIVKKYEDNIIALDHYTISKSPVENICDLLGSLPKDCSLDVVGYSRGGLLADVLARCDQRNEVIGFSKDEISLVEREETENGVEDQDKIAPYMTQLAKLSKDKNLKVNRLIRVACPAQGTTLLSTRIDHFLNGLLWTVSHGIKAITHPIILLEVSRILKSIRTFIMEIVRTKQDPSILPGINSMVPGSIFQNIINSPNFILNNHIVVIEGNAELGRNLKQSIVVILTNLFYRVANDFVVDTKSMTLGGIRRYPIQFFTSKDASTNHFNYFKNENTQKALNRALHTSPGVKIDGFEFKTEASENRGVVIDFVKLGEERGSDITGDRPIVILLPGIMGSNLSSKGGKVWVDFGEIGKGHLVKSLSIGNEVTAESAIGKYYTGLVEYLERKYDVCVFAFDWRLSLKELAENFKAKFDELRLHEQPIKIVAHSMGGLVVKRYISDNFNDWKKYSSDRSRKFIMLGTPWKGSYLIMEAMLGKLARIRQLSILDTKHTNREILKVINSFPGMLQLLPIDSQNKFETKAFWNKYIDYIPERIFETFDYDVLKSFGDYKKNHNELVEKYDELSFDNVFYIAGKASSTTTGFQLKSSIFGKKIRFEKTHEGDGSVTWASGIPEFIKDDSLYYVDTEHGNLACDAKLYKGIEELLAKGSTSAKSFNKKRPGARSGEGSIFFEEEIVSSSRSNAIDILMGISDEESFETEEFDKIKVSITNGDLTTSRHALMVGHFENDAIVSAEGALNRAINNKLVDRHRMDSYPGKVGESLILIDTKLKPKGAIVIGLADSKDLNSYKLTSSVTQGIINYILYCRDHHYDSYENFDCQAITSLCIGSAYGRLPMRRSLQAILTGISKANEKIKQIDKSIPLITKVEFIDYYKHIAAEAYHCLTSIKEDDKRLNIEVVGRVNMSHGAKEKHLNQDTQEWWHHLSTTWVLPGVNSWEKPRIKFLSSSGLARVEEQSTITNPEFIQRLLKDYSLKSEWNSAYSKAMLGILMPHNFKDLIRQQNNILWRLDAESANYPWELFHDADYDNEPTFIKAGLIRQLETEEFRIKPEFARNKVALVIGNSSFDVEGFNPLPGAESEARAVSEILSTKYDAPPLINEMGSELMVDIFSKKYKILHIASHGIFDEDDTSNNGIVFTDDMILPAEMIRSLSNVPEFVFINCCFLGAMPSKTSKTAVHRNRLAANIGREFINLGVEAVVVAGWAVDDIPAATFATSLYKNMMSGFAFGDAVRMARKDCYSEARDSTTWGAYQCYGNQWYKFDPQKYQSYGSDRPYLNEDEVIIDLDNLLVEIQGVRRKSIKKEVTNLERIIKKAGEAELLSGSITEREAKIYQSLNLLDDAVYCYETLMNMEKASYTVKSIEQYYNAKIKLIVKNSDPETSKKDIKEIEGIVYNLNVLKTFGQTSERYNLLGSSYKRLAFISKGASRKKYLSMMEENYKESYMMNIDNDVKAAYPLSNWMTGHAFFNPKGDVMVKDQLVSPEKALQQYSDLLELRQAEHKYYWDDIAKINIWMSQILYCTDTNDINDLGNKVLASYKDAWNIGGNASNLFAEIEHIEFVTAMIGTARGIEKARLTVFNQIKDEIEAMFEE